MAWSLRDRVAIVGIGETRYTRRGETVRSEMDLACEAIVNAVADAGLTLDQVDGLVAYGGDRCTIVEVAQALALRLSFGNLYPGGGNATTGVVHNAALAIGTGTAQVVVCYRSICQGQHLRYGQGRAGYGAHASGLGDTVGSMQAFAMPFGLISPVQFFALEARRHMHLYGTTIEQFGRVATTCYDNAQRNPRAIMHGRPLSLEQHARARMISEPYRLTDCCLESDGACAVVLSSSSLARDLKERPVLLAGATQGMERNDGYWRTDRRDEHWANGGMTEIAARLYADAGIGPHEIDVAQVYDHFTGSVIMALEDFGFCRRGEGGPFVESGAITWGSGSLPINTSGGNIAEAYVHGLSLVVEGVRQMRGTSTSQVGGAEHCLVTSGSGAPPSSALILRRAP